MNIKERGDNYEIYTDGSVRISCSTCKREDFLKPDNRIAINFNQLDIPNKGRDYICFNCWKAEQEKKKEKLHERKINEIIVGQAVNLAVQTIINLRGDEIKRGGVNFEELLNKSFEFYYGFLKKIYEDKNNKNL